MSRAVKRRRLSPPEDDAAKATSDFYQNASKWNLEDAYNERATKQKKKDKKSNKLPIKRGAEVGAFEQDVTQKEEDIEEGDANEEADAPTAPADSVEAQAPVIVVDTRSVKEQILEAKEELARMAGLLSEDPEEHIAQLKGLAKVADSKNTTVRRLAMVTQLAVYKDIIPGYRIRALSEEDMKAKVSKDVKSLRNFEQTLVSCYRDYVRGLARVTKGSDRFDPGSAEASVATTAFSCVCALIEAAPHFNFRNDLLNTLVLKLSSRQIDRDGQTCVETLETMFQQDEGGNSSLEAVSLLTKMFKSKDYNIHESVLNTFLQLRLLSEYSYRASTNRIDKEEDAEPINIKVKKKDRQFRTKRERKLVRERKGIEKEMKEADAVVSHEERDKFQSEMLKMVFVAYFRILKQRKQNLMGAVLEGLARYAHLINQDFFGDILEALRDLMANHSIDEGDDDAVETPITRDKSREALLCTVTAFALLQGQDVSKSASTLHLDLSFFTKQLYNTILPLSLDPAIETAKQRSIPQTTSEDDPKSKRKINVLTPSLLLNRSATALLLPAQQARAVPRTLLAAFVKRLMSAALHLPERSALAVLALVKQAIKVHGAKVGALWYSEERTGDGVFDAEREEWGSANPFATNVWEGEILRLHWSERVKEAAREVVDAVLSRRG